MNIKLFPRNGVLFAGRFPEVKDYAFGLPGFQTKYEKAKAEAIAASLPVSNPELYEDINPAICLWREGELYEWEGSAEIIENSSYMPVYKLIPPKEVEPPVVSEEKLKKPMIVDVYVHESHRPYRACFTIGVQTFYVCEREDEQEAEMYVRMLKIAFTNAGLSIQQTRKAPKK